MEASPSESPSHHAHFNSNNGSPHTNFSTGSNNASPHTNFNYSPSQSPQLQLNEQVRIESRQKKTPLIIFCYSFQFDLFSSRILARVWTIKVAFARIQSWIISANNNNYTSSRSLVSRISNRRLLTRVPTSMIWMLHLNACINQL